MWVSDDLLNWEFHAVEHIPVAPDLVKYKGKFYLTGNSDHVFVADHPLGPYKDLGLFKDTGPIEDGWNGGFDTKIFVDDDGQPYLFWPGRGISGIYGVRLDPKDLTRFAEKPTHLFGFNPMHAWERYGEMNEYPAVAWIEGPWIIKRNGIYYLEYSASGTQWKTRRSTTVVKSDNQSSENRETFSRSQETASSPVPEEAENLNREKPKLVINTLTSMGMHDLRDLAAQYGFQRDDPVEQDL